MSFLSPAFALLVVVALAAYRVAPAAWRPHFLLGVSCLVYAAWDPVHLVLLLGLTLGVHQAALFLGRSPASGGRLAWAGLSVAALLAVMFTFKAVAGLLEAWRAAPSGPALTALLAVPLGLSYYLFRLIGYLLDVYWGKLPPQRSFVSLALYASFFPQIMSGPIQRAGDFFGQLPGLAPPGPEEVSDGLRRILLGLVKKVAIADRLADVVACLHGDPSRYSSLELLIGAYAFAVQLYADFSGLTDIALGLGKLFGLRGPENFELPFLAPSLPAYWRRWHMSLTSWLRDYLFTPLRLRLRHLGEVGLALAILVNMVAVGIWHGTAWTYAAFGALHGLLLVASALTLRRRDAFFRGRPGLSRLRAVLGPLVTFHLVVAALIVFRASSLPAALGYFSHLLPGIHREVTPTRLSFALAGRTPASLFLVFLGAAAVEALEWARRQPAIRQRFLGAPWPLRWGLYYVGFGLLLLYGTFAAQKFIYAQF